MAAGSRRHGGSAAPTRVVALGVSRDHARMVGVYCDHRSAARTHPHFLAFGKAVLEKQMADPSYLPATLPKDSNPDRVMDCSECRLAAIGGGLDPSFFEDYLKDESTLGSGCTLRSVLAGLRLSAAAISGRDPFRLLHPGGQAAPDPKRVEAAYRLVTRVHEKCSS